MVKTYATESYDLAEMFLEDTPHLNTETRRDELARLIQTTIEDYLTSEERNYEPPDSTPPTGGTAEDLRQQQIAAMRLK